MDLQKVQEAKSNSFGSLTGAGHLKLSQSIFGKNACSQVCSYQDSFNDISIDQESLEMFSKNNFEKLEKEIATMSCQDKTPVNTKKFEMNVESFQALQQELKNANQEQGRVFHY